MICFDEMATSNFTRELVGFLGKSTETVVLPSPNKKFVLLYSSASFVPFGSAVYIKIGKREKDFDSFTKIL